MVIDKHHHKTPVIAGVEAVGKPEKHWVFEEKLAVIR